MYYVGVQYSGQKTLQIYTYKCPIDIPVSIGDGVLCLTPRGIAVAMVKSVHLEKPDFKCKAIFQKIDMDRAKELS